MPAAALPGDGPGDGPGGGRRIRILEDRQATGMLGHLDNDSYSWNSARHSMFLATVLIRFASQRP